MSIRGERRPLSGRRCSTASACRETYPADRSTRYMPFAIVSTGAGTNLKVGEGAAVWRESGGTGPARSAGKIFWPCPSNFLGSKSTISRFGERFRDGQYSLVSFLLAYFFLTVLPLPSHL